MEKVRTIFELGRDLAAGETFNYRDADGRTHSVTGPGDVYIRGREIDRRGRRDQRRKRETGLVGVFPGERREVRALAGYNCSDRVFGRREGDKETHQERRAAPVQRRARGGGQPYQARRVGCGMRAGDAEAHAERRKGRSWAISERHVFNLPIRRSGDDRRGKGHTHIYVGQIARRKGDKPVDRRVRPFGRRKCAAAQTGGNRKNQKERRAAGYRSCWPAGATERRAIATGRRSLITMARIGGKRQAAYHRRAADIAFTQWPVDPTDRRVSALSAVKAPYTSSNDPRIRALERRKA